MTALGPEASLICESRAVEQRRTYPCQLRVMVAFLEFALQRPAARPTWLWTQPFGQGTHREPSLRNGEDLAELELYHRRHARVGDRVATARDTGLRNSPFSDAAANRVGMEIAILAAELITRTQHLALTRRAARRQTETVPVSTFCVAVRHSHNPPPHPGTWPQAEAIT